MSDTQPPIVSYSQDGPVATVMMDDGKANALSPKMIEELSAAVARAGEEAKAIVIAGREGRFSAGFDLKIMMQGPDAAKALVLKGGELFLTLYQLPIPVVIACTGHAVAGGILLTATGDIRIGAQGAFKLGLNEVSVGMPVPVLAHEFARARLLPTELFAAVVHAKIYDPESATRAGWLDRTAAPDKLLGDAQAEAARLAALPGSAYAMSKRSLRRETVKYIRETIDSNLAELMVRPS